MVEFRGEDIEVEIQYAIHTWSIVHIFVYLVLVFDTDHLAHEATSEGWLDIVPDIAGEIGKIPGILLILYRPLEIEMVFVGPEIRVFIDMYEFES
jgi:hypothetical protein